MSSVHLRTEHLRTELEAEPLVTWRSKYPHLKIQGHVGMLEGLFILLGWILLGLLLGCSLC